MSVPKVEVFAEDLGFIEGPVWDGEARTLSLVSISRGRVYTLDGRGGRLAEYETGGGPNGLVKARDGLLVAQNGGIFGAAGAAAPGVQSVGSGDVRYVASERFTAPNDLAFGPDGRLYVTDPMTDRAILEPVEGRVFACDLATGEAELVIEGRLCPNGLAFTADGQGLLLAQTQPRLIERFAIQKGKLVSQGVFCNLVSGRPDGLALDAEGGLWICTPGTGGIEVFDAGGSFVRRIEIGPGSMTTNLCFGGLDDRSLFVTAAGWGQVLRLDVGVAGAPLFAQGRAR
jgi:gluconolactonase